ncbi:HlyD family type I secretion periplasmic adaptor subunit [Pararhodospirillum oryzae]|uniref:Membrane fusion protein (MFP) family protein n=1 Tax=Pararhodospirillum oryzae TaxID=478448 RepID=A0A512H641_9PROT|nr:HlyD family type I secretion periplasmic adaptor subunit [Pararhodospirillum oryzae]GEO80894.1 HlyD family type I secretion periplasmic adaptor subunit [Pararhodospirillum oryzae]
MTAPSSDLTPVSAGGPAGPFVAGTASHASTSAAGRSRVSKGSRQTRYLGQSVMLEEAGMSRYVRLAMITAAGVVTAFLVWASLTHLEEVSIAFGQVAPSGSVRVVQHLEGGIVQEISVDEGQLVKDGEILLKMSPDAALSELQTMRARFAALSLQAERLRAFGAGREPDFSFLSDEYKALKDDQMSIFRTQVANRETSRAVLVDQIRQKRESLTLLDEQEHALNEQLSLVGEELGMREELMRKGLTSRVTLLDTRRTAASVKGDIVQVLGNKRSVMQEIAEINSRLGDLDATLRQEALKEMGAVTSELAQVREAMSKAQDRVARLEVRAPVSGYVQDMKVKTVGAVVPAGGIILNIVPVEENLRVEARIQTRDIGHVAVGQPVKVKVTSYDFSRYGYVTGKLTAVSATTFVDEDNNPYYKGFVSLDKDYVGTDPERNPVLPGMTVQADIITGDKTLLQYLLKPVYRNIETAFHER